ESHIYHYEGGGASVLGGVAYHLVATDSTGELPLPALADAGRDPEDSHEAITRLICLENTHNRCGGVVLSTEYMRSVHQIARARRVRKLVGGGMRQAGIIAAAGIVALEQMVDRLAEDHANARLLAEGLATFPQINIDLGTVQSDIVIFRLHEGYGTPETFARAVAERGLLIGGI